MRLSRFAIGFILAGAVLAPGLGLAEVTTSRTLEDLGLTESLRAQSTRPTLSLPFALRADHVPISAFLRLRIAPGPEDLTLSINQQPVARWEGGVRGSTTEEEIRIDPLLIGDHNFLTFELERTGSRTCSRRVPEGTWTRIEGGELSIEASPLPLANDLALLPLPFVDVEADRSTSVPIVFFGPPSTRMIRVAGLVAAYFGVRSGSRARFPVYFDRLPDRSAVVLGTSDRTKQLGLPPDAEPRLTMIDHPAAGPREKLLVLSAAAVAGLESAAHALLSRDDLESPTMAVSPPEHLLEPAPYEAPGWVRPNAPIRLGDIAKGKSLEHRGGSGDVTRLGFRVAPDLVVWPSERFVVDLIYQHITPIEGVSPDLEVAFNGFYVGRSQMEETEDGLRRERFQIHRSLLRGYNELALHVGYEDEEGALCDPLVADSVRTVVSPESTIHLEGLRHFAELPDLRLFVHDGYPFSRVSDLREMLILLPKAPREEEIGAALSVLAHLAAVTGAPGSRVEIRTGRGEIESADGKDLLVVAAGRRLPLPSTWRERMPVRFRDRDGIVSDGKTTDRVLAWLTGRRPAREARQVRDLLARSRRRAAAVAFESPLTPGRSVVVLTAPEAAGLPALGDFQRPAQGLDGPADVLVLGGDTMLPAKLGSTFAAGDLGLFTRARWFVAQHWLLLLPSLLLGTLLPSLVLRRHLDRRAERRLSWEEMREVE